MLIDAKLGKTQNFKVNFIKCKELTNLLLKLINPHMEMCNLDTMILITLIEEMSFQDRK